MNRTITFRPIHLVGAALLVGAGLILGLALSGARLDPGSSGPAPVSLVDAAAPAAAVSDDPSAATNAAKTAANPGLLRLLVGRTIRAQITTDSAAGTRDILYVRGAISQLTGTSITIGLADGSSQKFGLDSKTLVREKGQPQALSDLSTGERVMVFGLKNADGTYTARLIRCIQPAVKPGTTAPGPGVSPTASPGAG
jgi:hypothetical protein